MDVIKLAEGSSRGEKHVTFCRLAVNPATKTSPHCALWNGEYGGDPYDSSCYQLGRENKYARDSAYSE